MKRDILKIDEELCNSCGQCVPNCHEGAITIENREAELYSEVRVMEQMDQHAHEGGGCPGSRAMIIEKPSDSVHGTESVQSELRQWPVQMHLINPNASYFRNSDLLLAADCVAYSESLWLPV